MPLSNEVDMGFNVPQRESGQTSPRSIDTRTLEEPTKAVMHMTADSSAGATPHDSEDWHTIDWKRVNENVRRLQARIVKATKEGKWHKVHALQYLLTHSFSGTSLAVRRVTENQGKNTPGVDGETWNDPPKKRAAIHSLKRHGYQPRPLRRVYIPKSNGKMRPLGIPMCPAYCTPSNALWVSKWRPAGETGLLRVYAQSLTSASAAVCVAGRVCVRPQYVPVCG